MNKCNGCTLLDCLSQADEVRSHALENDEGRVQQLVAQATGQLGCHQISTCQELFEVLEVSVDKSIITVEEAQQIINGES